VPENNEPAEHAGSPAATEGLSEAELEHLVDRVYRLFQHELRLGRARGEPHVARSRPMGRPLC
jgi:hypothetical protein